MSNKLTVSVAEEPGHILWQENNPKHWNGRITYSPHDLWEVEKALNRSLAEVKKHQQFVMLQKSLTQQTE